MKRRYRLLRRLALLLLVVVPLVAWFVVKPVRVVAPTLLGLDCGDGPVCAEDPSRLPEAERLYADSVAFVAREISPLQQAPRVVFCSSPACAEAFGLGARAGVTVGTFGTVISPRGWTPYYLRHELIHHLQGQRVGSLRRLLLPEWFVEGMGLWAERGPALAPCRTLGKRPAPFPDVVRHHHPGTLVGRGPRFMMWRFSTMLWGATASASRFP